MPSLPSRILRGLSSEMSRIRIGESTAISNNVTIIDVKSVEVGARCLLGGRTLVPDSVNLFLNPA